MAYDPVLAERIRAALADHAVVEKRVIGGLGFLLNGNMVCGIQRQNHLFVHVPESDMGTLLKRLGAKPFVMGAKTMRSWLLVEPASIKTAPTLKKWIDVGLAYVQTLPTK